MTTDSQHDTRLSGPAICVCRALQRHNISGQVRAPDLESDLGVAAPEIGQALAEIASRSDLGVCVERAGKQGRTTIWRIEQRNGGSS